MAFTSAITGRTKHHGGWWETFGTFTNTDASTGGDVATGLRECWSFELQNKGTGTVSNAVVVNETMPVAGSAVTIVTNANDTGYWSCIGRD